MSGCKYVSKNLLQCKNVITDNSDCYCEKHDSHIYSVRTQAKKTKAVLDPGAKKGYDEEDFDAVRDMAPYIYEPCCSESFAESSENPLRNAGKMTEKEIARQYDAALSRTLERLRDMRMLAIEKYREHLNSKPLVKKEQKKYKLVVRNRKERGMLDRLKKDQGYASPKSSLTPYAEKVYRKHALEINGGRARPSDYLRDPKFENAEYKCDGHDRKELKADPNASYSLPVLPSDAFEDEIIDGVLNSVIDCVEKRLGGVIEVQCANLRIPMTDFCPKHVRRDPDQKLFVACKSCSVPCLPFNGHLCSLHKAPKLPLPQVRPSLTSSLPIPLSVNGKHQLVPVSNGTKALLELPPPISLPNKRLALKNGSVDKPVVSENGSDLKFPESSLLSLATRKFIQTNGRRIMSDAFALPDNAYTVEQKKLKLSNECTVIDDDISLFEIETQLKKVDQKPKPLLIPNGPVAILQNVRTINRTMMSRGRSSVPSTIQAVNRGRMFDSSTVNLNSCARTRPFTASSELQRPVIDVTLNDPQRRQVISRSSQSMVMRASPGLRHPTHPRPLQYPGLLSNGSYCISQSQNPVSNMVRQAPNFKPNVVRNITSNNIQYVKNGTKTVPAVAISR